MIYPAQHIGSGALAPPKTILPQAHKMKLKQKRKEKL